MTDKASKVSTLKTGARVVSSQLAAVLYNLNVLLEHRRHEAVGHLVSYCRGEQQDSAYEDYWLQVVQLQRGDNTIPDYVRDVVLASVEGEYPDFELVSPFNSASGVK